MLPLILAALLAVPANPNAPAPTTDDGIGQCTWGTVRVRGDRMTIGDARQTMHAAGTLRDGIAVLVWSIGGELAIGFYAFDGATFDGEYRYLNKAEPPVPERFEIRK